jgi:hypothetical protein
MMEDRNILRTTFILEHQKYDGGSPEIILCKIEEDEMMEMET